MDALDPPVHAIQGPLLAKKEYIGKRSPAQDMSPTRPGSRLVVREQRLADGLTNGMANDPWQCSNISPSTRTT